MNKQRDEQERIRKALEERLRFENLLSDISARFVQVSADRLDREIESALKLVVDFFQIERCGLIRTSRDRTAWQLTHVAYANDLVPRVPAVGWLFWSGQTVWGSVLLIWSIAVVAMDNVLRPVLIKKGADLPLLLIFAGVIGGLLGFGIIGLFIGPVVLAVTYTLLGFWIGEDQIEPDQGPPGNPQDRPNSGRLHPE